MRYQITKIKNGLWIYENEKGVRTEHSLQSGAEKMRLHCDEMETK